MMNAPIYFFTQVLLVILYVNPIVGATAPTQVDSVIQQYDNYANDVLVDTLVNKALASIGNLDYETGMAFAREAFEIGKAHQLDEATHRALITYARLGVLTNDIDQPFKELQSALAQRIKEGNAEKQYSILNAIALLHEQRMEYDQMAKLLYEANEILEASATPKRPLYIKRSNSYINMGHCVLHEDKLKAHRYFRKSLELALLSKDSATIYMSQSNLAFSCIDLELYEEGLNT